MPDITMCMGSDCPVKTHCYRFTATPTPHWQAYFTEPPYGKDNCDYYVRDTKDGKKENEDES